MSAPLQSLFFISAFFSGNQKTPVGVFEPVSYVNYKSIPDVTGH